MNKPSQQTIRSCVEPFVWFREPTMAEILSDPIVRAVMRADNVDPEAMERRLMSVASMLASAERAAGMFAHIEPQAERHGRTCSGHPRLAGRTKAWMRGTKARSRAFSTRYARA